MRGLLLVRWGCPSAGLACVVGLLGCWLVFGMVSGVGIAACGLVERVLVGCDGLLSVGFWAAAGCESSWGMNLAHVKQRSHGSPTTNTDGTWGPAQLQIPACLSRSSLERAN